MKRREKIKFIIPMLLVFCILGLAVFSVARRISVEMSRSAIGNLEESLKLIRNTIEAVYNEEAEFQKLLAAELAAMEEPESFILAYNRNQTMVKLSLIPAGKTRGISSTGEEFSEKDLDFTGQNTISGLPISKSYVNSMGAWAYTLKCPVVRDGEEIGTFYVEYIYETLENILPDKLYNGSASIFIMDSDSQRFVLKPKSGPERSAGNVNLEDFYRGNNILEKNIQDEAGRCIQNGDNLLFYHDIQRKKSLIYMWAVNGGSTYLIGFVPIEAIQREGSAVNQNILIVVIIMLTAFFICCGVYFFNERQQMRIRKEREEEREIHNQRLAEALQAAQIANQSKTTFLSNMSHDIRTPMNAILGFTTLLAKDAESPEKVREYTKKITTSSHHLLSLINDVLDVSKIESGKVVLTIGEFTLNDLVSSLDAIIRPAAKARKQEFHVSVTGIHHEYLVGDETRLNQILINLLSNAVKYTQEGGSIWFRIIGLPQRSSQYEHIRIEVEDNGYGMTPEYLVTIFDAFTRAENSTTNKVQGTGLGMAITKNIVELMGGTIDVTSQEGKGSLFTVELELRIPEREIDEQFWAKYQISRILAVDDEEDVRENIRILIENAGIYADTASGGEEAFARLEAERQQGRDYQVILLDYKMAGADGIEMARQLRREIPDSVFIFLLTSYDWDGVEEEALRAGIDGFLSKPFFVSALKEKILDLHLKGSGTDHLHSREERIQIKGLHFLAAEDNEINAEILLELFDMEGATCEIVENGQLAVERFQRALPGEFDAVLMDVQMPVLNGYEATRAIRALDREDAGTIPIIAMTANAFAEDVREAMNAGMNAHVAKPIDMELLKKTVNQYL